MFRKEKPASKLEKALKKEIFDSGTQLNHIAFAIDDHICKLHSENENRVMLVDIRIELMGIVNKLFKAGLIK